jgi:hypothetical protein
MFAPSPQLPACVYENRAGRQKEWWDNIVCLDNFAVLSLTFFQLNCDFWGERERSMISQPTDRYSPRRHNCPLAFIKTERGDKKNGETTSYALTILQFIHSPFFN